VERRHQERLVGAVVVVVLAALFVPWLLDGSPERWRQRGRDPGMPATLQRKTVDLRDPGVSPDVVAPAQHQLATVPRAEPRAGEKRSAGGGAPSADGMAASSGAAPVRGTTGSAGTESPTRRDAPMAGPTSTTPEKASSAEGGRESAPAVAGQPEMDTVVVAGWAVQVGSFRQRANAQGLVDELSRKGYRAFLVRHTRGQQVWFRVRVGTEQTRAAAQATAARLRREGQVTSIVRHP
jgi:DedD protein